MGKGGGSGGGGAPTQTTSTAYQTNVPEYARPYVENMLGATQRQLFNVDSSGAITGFQPYQPYSTDPSAYVAGFSPMQEQAFRGIAGLQVPSQYGAATGATAAATQAALGAQYQPGQFGNQYQAPGQYTPGQFGVLAAQAPELQQYQMGAPERVRTGAFTQPGAAQAYMSPYIEQALAPQLAEIQRQSDITQQGLRGQAVAAGAFGGTRQALQASEQERNKQALMNQTVGQGYQNAYQQAMQQYSTDAARQLAAQQANQQAGLTAGQANLQALLGTQALGAGQSMQAQLANQAALQQAQQAAEQSRQYGYGQGMTSAQLAAQYGLAGQQAAEQSRQFGAGYGMQGLGMGLQGAAQLGTLGGQQLQAQQGILSAQQQAGSLQQAQQQAIINQAIQDYATAQQYPLMQLGFMSNMIRGLPMQATTTQQYQAAPNPYSQAIGAIGTLGSALRGGQSTSGFAKGGIASIGYSVGGDIKSKLYDMDIEDLRREAKTSTSESVRQMATNILRDRMQEQQPQQLAGGGIVAFAEPNKDNNYSLVEGVGTEDYPVKVPSGPVDPRFERAWTKAIEERRAPENEVKARTTPVYDEMGNVISAETAPEPTRAPAAAPAPTAPSRPFTGPATPPGITAVSPPAAPAASVPARPAVPTAPAAPVAARPAAPAGGAPSGLMSIQDFMKTLPAEMKAEPVESAEDYLRRRQAYIGPDTDRQERRKQLMKERANVEDEAARRRDERLGQFFAQWGTTPGPFLVAGMESYKKFAENNIADRDARTKALREIDKSISELNSAARAEKAGDFDAAEKHKEKGKEIAQRVNANILSAYGHVTSAQATLEGVKERAKAAAGEKTRGNYDHAVSQLRMAEGKIQDERLKPGPYATAVQRYNAISSLPNPTTEQKKMMDEAKAVIDARVAADEKRLQLYRENVDRAAKSAGYDTITPVAPAAPEPPAQAIAALKSDPSLAKQFDQKYGAGASARILGR